MSFKKFISRLPASVKRRAFELYFKEVEDYKLIFIWGNKREGRSYTLARIRLLGVV